jgi:type II secretory pathway predicted ATPase ExeA
MPYRTFELTRSPFSPEIDIHALFQYDAFTQCQARLDFVRRERGFAAITGEVGSGKTTVLRSDMQRLAPSSFTPLYAAVPHLTNPMVSIAGRLLEEMGEKPPHLNPARCLQMLNRTLYATYDKGRLPYVVIDEAHLLDDRNLLLIKTLLNHDMDSRMPLVLVISGGPDLARRLAQRNLEEIRQRLLFIYPMHGLSRNEVDPYLAARLKAAGCDRRLFPPDVVDEIYRHTQGVPRLVNQLANLSLVAAANARRSDIDSTCLLQALKEMGRGDDAGRRAFA